MKPNKDTLTQRFASDGAGPIQGQALAYLKDRTEDALRELQQLGDFDTKTSSWVKTPSAIRKLGGALFADRRYDHVFVYHNGAQSYYAARAFRGSLRV
jgi:hypothetical protein